MKAQYVFGWFLSLSLVTIGPGLVLAQSSLIPPQTGKAEPGTQNVGISKKSDVILPGGEIEPIPQEDRKSPIILRMEKVDPTENGFHYRLVSIALEPGEFDLRKYLRWKDPQNKAPIPDRPEWHIKVTSILPPGQILPKELPATTDIRVGGYKYLLAGAALFWGLGLLAILFWPGPKPLFQEAPKPQKTVADRLRPLVEKILNGDASPANQAALEQTLMRFWRERLKLEKAEPYEALSKLKGHSEAGDLLRTLEDWLHRPAANRPTVDIDKLLAPYRKHSAEKSLSTGGAHS